MANNLNAIRPAKTRVVRTWGNAGEKLELDSDGVIENTNHP